MRILLVVQITAPYTQFLGFREYGDEFKLMGLTAHGRASFVDSIRCFVHLLPDGSFRLDTRNFNHAVGRFDWSWNSAYYIGNPAALRPSATEKSSACNGAKWREMESRVVASTELLADPRRAEMRDYLNRKIKYREPFRPSGALTGVPLLLNTSFNESEPIMDTPQQAFDCFVRTGMDVLVIGRTAYTRTTVVVE